MGLFLCIKLVYTGFLPIGAYLTTIFGILSPCIFSIIISIIAHLILLFFTNYWIIGFAFFLFGVAIGIGYMPSIINIWRYYPKNRGMGVGVVLTAFASSSVILEFIAEKIINPESKQPSDNCYYPFEISENFNIYLIALIFLFLVFGIAIIFLIKPYYELNKQNKSHIYGKLYEELKEDNTVTTRSEDTNIQDNSLTLCFKSSPFFQLTILFFFSTLFGTLHSSTSKNFGKLNNHPDSLIASAVLLWNITNFSFRVFWGFLLDEYGYKNIYLIALFVQIFTFSVLYFIAQFQFLFFIFNFLSALSYGGTAVSTPFAFEKTFGINNGGITFGICQFVIAIISFGVPYLIENLKEENINFFILFLCNSLSTMISIIVLCFIEEKKFDYNKGKNYSRLSSSISSYF